MTADDAFKEFKLEAIRNNGGAWFATFGRIWAKDRTQGIVTPKPNFLQWKIQEVMNKFEELGLPVRIAGLKPRARGSTTFFTAQGYTAMRRSSISAVFIGGQSDQTVGLWNMIKTYHANDRFDWKNTGDVNEKGASFSNGSRAKKETAKDVQAGIGDTYQLLHCTEAARWSTYGVANSADVMANILKAVPLLPSTYVFLESTAEGAAGDFYDRYVGAVDADDFLNEKVKIRAGDYVRIFAPWFEFEDSALRLTEDEKQEIRSTLDQDPQCDGEQELIDTYGRTDDNGVQHLGTVVDDYDVWEQLAWRRYAIEKECKKSKENFNQDYPHSWRTAFLKSGSQRFNLIGLEKQRQRMQKRPPPSFGVIELGKSTVNFRKTTQGEATHTVFEKPIPGCRYIVSVDTMTGETQVGGKDPDWHSAFCLRAGYWNAAKQWVRAATAARVIQCRWDVDLFEANGVWPLARMYGSGASGAIVAVETNMDRGVIELLKLRGANLYQREFWNQREVRISNALGFRTDRDTRETVIEELARAIREWDKLGEGMDIWCPIALGQCDNFVRKKKGRSEGAEGWHDDDVMAIAIGMELIGHATIYHPPINPYQCQPWEQVGAQRGPSQYS